MKKLFLAISSAALLLTSAAACDSSNGSEPDAPIESGNPADTISTDTVPSDTIPQITPPEQKPQGLDSIIIPEDLELVEYVPYSGPVEELADEFRPIYVKGRRWNRVDVYERQELNCYITEIACEDINLNGIITPVVDTARIVRTYYSTGQHLYNNFFRQEGSVMTKAYAGDAFYFNGQYGHEWNFKMAYDVNASESEIYSSTIMHVYAIPVSRGVITLRGKKLHATKVWTGRHYQKRVAYDYWVEGIGPLFVGMIDHDPIFTTPRGTLPFPLLVQCVDENGELIYDYRDFDPDLYEELEILSDIDKQS
ncbi:MAG: hypothetical protein K2I26_09110 [Paramuribaculum sp.]|nr:hypothetical protein [Paramuribaculum sp.]